MTKCPETTFYACEPENICKDDTHCVNCGMQLHFYKGKWYRFVDLPIEADDSPMGLEHRQVIEQLKKQKTSAEG